MTATTRMAELRARKRTAGLVPVEVWVPAADADEIRRIAREMCDKEKTE